MTILLNLLILSISLWYFHKVIADIHNPKLISITIGFLVGSGIAAAVLLMINQDFLIFLEYFLAAMVSATIYLIWTTGVIIYQKTTQKLPRNIFVYLVQVWFMLIPFIMIFIKLSNTNLKIGG
jgi:hypothetical protein